MQQLAIEPSANLTNKDKLKIADLHNVSLRYINMLLEGTRDGKSPAAQAILKDLQILSNINFLVELEKEEVLNSTY